MKKTKFVIFGLLLAGLLLLEGCSSMKDGLDSIKGQDGVFAAMDTTNGAIIIKLHYKEVPLTVTNFVGLAEGTLTAAKGKPFYDGLKFHRVISKANGDAQDFMVQGGDPQGSGRGGPGYKFPDEFDKSLRHDEPGVLSMANSGPNTNGSQFFITIVETPWLDDVHSIFGKVVYGQKAVDTMKQGAKINSIKIVRQGEEAEKFTATQADFDRLLKEVKDKAEAAKKAEKEAKIAEVKEEFPEAIETEDGIFYEIMEEGKGEVAGKGKSVEVHYNGMLMDGRTFDSSYGRGTLPFVTAGGQMIPGFDIMVQEMKVGEKRRMILPPELAYGEQGYPPVIPANSYLIFEVELVKVK